MTITCDLSEFDTCPFKDEAHTLVADLRVRLED